MKPNLLSHAFFDKKALKINIIKLSEKHRFEILNLIILRYPHIVAEILDSCQLTEAHIREIKPRIIDGMIKVLLDEKPYYDIMVLKNYLPNCSIKWVQETLEEILDAGLWLQRLAQQFPEEARLHSEIVEEIASQKDPLVREKLAYWLYGYVAKGQWEKKMSYEQMKENLRLVQALANLNHSEFRGQLTNALCTFGSNNEVTPIFRALWNEIASSINNFPNIGSSVYLDLLCIARL